ENEIHVGDGRSIFHMQRLGKNGWHEVEDKQQYRFDNFHDGKWILKSSLIETVRDNPLPGEKCSEWKCTPESSFSIATTKDCTPNDRVLSRWLEGVGSCHSVEASDEFVIAERCSKPSRLAPPSFNCGDRESQHPWYLLVLETSQSISKSIRDAGGLRPGPS